MSMTRSGSAAEGRRRAHGINLSSLYARVVGERYEERYSKRIPDEATLLYFAKVLREHYPPEEPVAEWHRIMSREVRRWCRLRGIEAPLP